MVHWVDEMVSKSQQRADSETISREIHALSCRYGVDAFNNLIGAIRADIHYFMAKCENAHALEVKENVGEVFTIWSMPPYNSKVILTFAEDCITYEKSIRSNPRAEPRKENGRIFVKSTYEHSIWLEHRGERIDYDSASEFLIKDLFSSLLERA